MFKFCCHAEEQGILKVQTLRFALNDIKQSGLDGDVSFRILKFQQRIFDL